MNQPLHLDFPASTSFLSPVRALSSAWFSDSDVTQGDWSLIITELVTNAVLSAPERSSVAIDLSLAIDPAGVPVIRLVVSDDGPGFDLAAARRARHVGQGGRGLQIVEALTTSLSSASADGRHVVTCSAPARWLGVKTNAGDPISAGRPAAAPVTFATVSTRASG